MHLLKIALLNQGEVQHHCTSVYVTWAQDIFKILSSRWSSYFYIQDKNQVLCSQKDKLKQESLVSRKFKQDFYVSIKLNENPAIQALSKKIQNILSFNSACWLDIR